MVTEYTRTVELYDKIVTVEKKIHSFPDGLHQCYEDVESEEYMSVLCDWLNHKVKSFKPNLTAVKVPLRFTPVIHSYYIWRNRVFAFLSFYFVLRVLRRQAIRLARKVLNL